MKIRIDQFLVQLKLVNSVNAAQRLVMSGNVLVNDVVVTKPGHKVLNSANVRVKEKLPYVSRGGEKLAHALKYFNVNVAQQKCLDVGASTGGFTDCLLQNQAKLVYSVDVGTNQLAWKLRQDQRVNVLENYNFRYANKKDFANLFSVAVIDVSFISLKLIFPPLVTLLNHQANVISLIKPQFELQKALVPGGVVKDSNFYLPLLQDLVDFAITYHLFLQKIIISPIKGAKKSNIEFLAWWKYYPS